MTPEFLTSFLAWCTLINLLILLLWFFIVTTGGGWTRRLHGRWFALGDEEFASIHYRAMAYFKLLWIVFNLTPYLALRLFV